MLEISVERITLIYKISENKENDEFLFLDILIDTRTLHATRRGLHRRYDYSLGCNAV